MPSFHKIVAALKDKKNRSLLLLLAAAIVLLLLSGLFTRGTGSKTPAPDAQPALSTASTAQAELEGRLSKMLSQIEGVGPAQVMITYATGAQNVYVTEGKISRNNDDSRTSYDDQRTVLVVRGDGGTEQPVLQKQAEPEIRGVLVMCPGADNERAALKITEALKAVLDVSDEKICVAKGAET